MLHKSKPPLRKMCSRYHSNNEDIYSSKNINFSFAELFFPGGDTHSVPPRLKNTISKWQGRLWRCLFFEGVDGVQRGSSPHMINCLLLGDHPAKRIRSAAAQFSTVVHLRTNRRRPNHPLYTLLVAMGIPGTSVSKMTRVTSDFFVLFCCARRRFAERPVECGLSGRYNKEGAADSLRSRAASSPQIECWICCRGKILNQYTHSLADAGERNLDPELPIHFHSLVWEMPLYLFFFLCIISVLVSPRPQPLLTESGFLFMAALYFR